MDRNLKTWNPGFIRRFRDSSVRRKLFFVFGASLLFVVGIIVVGLINMILMKNTSRELYDEAFLEAQSFMRLDKGIERSRRTLLEMLFERDRTRLMAHMQQVNASAKEVDDNFNEMLGGGHHFDKAVLDSINDLKSIWERFKETRDKELIPEILAGNIDHASRIATGVQDQRFRDFIALSGRLVEQETQEAKEAQAGIEESFRNSIILYLLITVAGFLLTFMLLVYISRDIGKRLKAVADAIERIKNGELKLKIDVNGDDEIGFLAKNFNDMAGQLYENRIMQDQSTTILSWYSEENLKRIEELEKLNGDLSRAQNELMEKNSSLEKSIQEINEINNRLTKTRTQLIQSEKMASIGQLSAGVAHEINNPIGFVNSNLKALAGYIDEFTHILKMDNAVFEALKGVRIEEALDRLNGVESYKKEIDMKFALEDIGRLFEESNDGIERVISIVKGLKDFAHQGEALMKESDINKCLEDTMKLCWHEIKYKAELEKDLAELPPLLCHAQRLKQVFMNIIINAVQAMPEKGKISVRSFPQGPDAVIKISDSGTGIAQDVIKRIFEPFFTTKPVGQGTGLGLSIAYGIIKEHNGTIDVESTPGRGTVFTIKLPLAHGALLADGRKMHALF